MQVRFVLGPSGTGKTFRCLAQARAALCASPDGPPLIFLAPKQATFQLERQLLSDPALGGYTRLRILSFDRLAELVLAELGQKRVALLSEQGRLMVLRALLSQERKELKLFRATARLRGFALQLSDLLRELQRSGLTPEQLLALASKADRGNQLDLKLQDLAAMLKRYLLWLEEHHLRDADQLLGLAAEALMQRSKVSKGQGNPTSTPPAPSSLEPGLRFGGLWLDGFSELAPQELLFLTALFPFCDGATLAFNLERDSVGPISWLSPWTVANQTFEHLHQRFSEQAGTEVRVDWLERGVGKTRFSGNSILGHLEAGWSNPQPYGPKAGLQETIRIVLCANPEAEATLAAREIVRFVRAGGQYRELAVIVRNLESYDDPVRRVFSAFEIPFFLDRREPVGHHPFLELTRSALRTIAFGWELEDWFGALKTGLLPFQEADIDRLENEALARDWKGKTWLEPLKIPDNPEAQVWLEELRQQLVAPFQLLAADLGSRPSGSELAQGLAAFWERLGIASTLQTWSVEAMARGKADVAGLVHATIWPQMLEWLESLALAFAQETLGLRDWLPILEAGLASQTVGVIPPTLDQVLVGAIDRSRNPDLRLALILGMNESVFPAVPDEPRLLTTADRELLLRLGVKLGATTRHQLAQERYFGYIACTRAHERLFITCAQRDENDKALNRSPFIAHLQSLFPRLGVESAAGLNSWEELEHVSELIGPVLRRFEAGQPSWAVDSSLEALPRIAQLKARLAEFHRASHAQQLRPVLTECLYGSTLETSVSRLEEYAACPFRFALTSGLRVEERKLFRLDVRHQGSFQHEVLARFHQELKAENKQWRDLSAAEARDRIDAIAASLTPEYEGGLLQANEQTRFTIRSIVTALKEFITTIIEWMPQYQFEPHAVELAFGIEAKPLPAWEIDLRDGHRLSFRGKIDRIDLWRQSGDSKAWCVVMDYKSSARSLDPVLMAHGVQLQLLAYLNVLRALEDPEPIFGVKQLIPAGVFFVNLRGRYRAARTRKEALDSHRQARALAYQHTGRFDVSALPKLDNRTGVESGDQFKYRFRKDGQLHRGCREAMPGDDFMQMLRSVEGHLERMGREIYAGKVIADPYRKGNATACDQCDYQSVCRIDPWTHVYRVLQAERSVEDDGSDT